MHAVHTSTHAKRKSTGISTLAKKRKMSRRHCDWLREQIDAADRHPSELEGKDLNDDEVLRTVYYSCGFVHPDRDWAEYKHEEGIF